MAVLAGFALDVLVVARFGIGSTTDAFFAAYTIPLVLIGCAAALQPVLVSLLSAEVSPGTSQAGDPPRSDLFSALMTTTGLAAVALAGVGIAAAGPAMGLVAPGLNAPTTVLAVGVARVLFLRVPGAAVAEVLKVGLYAQRRFVAPTLSNAVPSLTAVGLLVATANRSPGGNHREIGVVAAGLVVGTLAQVALLAVLLFGRRPVAYRWRLRSIRSELPALRQAGGLVVAPLAGLLLRQAVTVAERILGSFLPAGSLTALSYANRLTMVAAGVFFDGMTTASMPSLAAAWAQGAGEAVRNMAHRLLGLAWLVAAPLGLGVAALSPPLVRLFFQRGQVDPDSAQLLAMVLGIYALSLPWLGPYRAVQTFLYATRQPGVVIVLHGILAAVTIGLDLVLVRWLGVAGLAAGFATGCCVTLAAGLAWLARRGGGWPDWQQIADSAWRVGLASAASAVVVFWSSRMLDGAVRSASLWGAMAGTGRWSQVVVVGISGLAGLAVLIGVGTLARAEAVVGMWRLVRRKRL
jgi:putative peptidoglycan lipid II flippase